MKALHHLIVFLLWQTGSLGCERRANDRPDQPPSAAPRAPAEVGPPAGAAVRTSRPTRRPRTPSVCTTVDDCAGMAKDIGALPLGHRSRDEARLSAVLEAACGYGDPSACLEAGRRYRFGRGVPVSAARAAELYERACTEDGAAASAFAAEAWHLGAPEVTAEADGEAETDARMSAHARKACDKREWRGCWVTGLLIRQKNPEDAGRLFDQACSHGFLRACADHAEFVGEHGKAPERVETARRIAERACQAGSADVCETLAAWYETDSFVRANDAEAASYRKRARRLRERDCEGGDLDTCNDLASAGRRGGAEGQRFAELACRAGYGAACARLSRFDPEGGRPPTEPQRKLLQRACDLGDLPGCRHLLAGLPVAKVDERLSLLRRACDLHGAEECLEEARLLTGGSPESVGLLRRACELGAALGCRDLGRALEHGPGAPRQAEAALDLYRKACHRDARACGGLAQAMMSGLGGSPDPARALRLFAEACAAQDAAACFVLAQSFAKGDGVPRDDGTADRLARWACLGSDVAGCVWQARRFETRGDRERALAFYYRACTWAAMDACDEVERLQGRKAAELPAQPRELDRQCLSGRARACFVLASKKDSKDARTFLRACHVAPPWGCREAAAILRRRGRQDEKAMLPLQAGCRSGDGASCADLADIDDGPDRVSAAELRACDLAYGFACDPEQRTIPPLTTGPNDTTNPTTNP